MSNPASKLVPGPTPFASFREFFKLEAAGGVLLFAAAVLAMVLKNSPFSTLYADLLTLPMQVRIGALNIDKPLVLWVNDGLMAVFFFMVALEIKREMLVGHLKDKSALLLPGLAALGGMLIPALLFVSLNWGDADALHGWAIPTTTDIAFAMAVIALVGPGIPPSLKIFLLTLAVLDDLGAIVVIALFYSGNLSLTSLSVGFLVITGLIVMNMRGVTKLPPYIWLGIVLWIAVLKSGVHATLAGVVLGFAIPFGDKDKPDDSPLCHLIHDLHPSVAFVILPLFAFLNAGVAFADFNPARLLNPVPVGIALGLLIGKPVGVISFAWLTVKLKIAELPQGADWRQMTGVAFICGIGFTMSIFLGSLAYQEGGSGYARADRVGIVAGSLVAGIVGYLLLLSTRSDSKHVEQVSTKATN